MDRWKVTYARQKGAGRPEHDKRQEATELKMADAVYECDHGLVCYKLRPDEAGLYYEPAPLCVDCKENMLLVALFGNKIEEDGSVSSEKPKLETRPDHSDLSRVPPP